MVVLLDTDRVGELKGYKHFFSSDFRISPQEKYLALKKGYLGKDDYAIVVKDLKTKEDVFVLPMTEIKKKNPKITGRIRFNDWARDGRYFWADMHTGAITLGFIRVDTKNWTYDLFPAPKDVLGGDALNLENGYITVHPGNVWFGVVELNEREKEKRRKQGIGTELYIQNLATGERHFVAKTDEPLWYFKPRWLSDTELEYALPGGEKRVYETQ